MKKTVIAISMASLILSACGESTPNTNQSVAEPAKTETPVVSQKAELGSFGVDLTARNEAVKPGDDFFMYASGNWYDNYEMPADKTSFGAFAALAERSEEQVKDAEEVGVVDV